MRWSYRGLRWWWWRWWYGFLHPVSGDGFHDEEDLPIEGVFVYCHFSPVSADTFFEGTFLHHVPLSSIEDRSDPFWEEELRVCWWGWLLSCRTVRGRPLVG